MKKFPFPWVALGVGVLIAVALERSGAMYPAEGNRLPLLTLLVMSEFGFIVTAIGAGLGLRALFQQRGNAILFLPVVGCTLLAAGFLWLGPHEHARGNLAVRG